MALGRLLSASDQMAGEELASTTTSGKWKGRTTKATTRPTGWEPPKPEAKATRKGEGSRALVAK